MLPIIDIKTAIHGITEPQVEKVKYTLRQAQAFLLNICTADTIIVGHAVHNDLKSLKFNHKTIIDTAYLFPLVNEPYASPSLRDISEQCLAVKLPEIHNSVIDARASLQAAYYYIRNITVPLITRTASQSTLSPNASLLIHKIPSSCKEEDLYQMFISHTSIAPLNISPITFDNNTEMNGMIYQTATGKCSVSFLTDKHADLAFETVFSPVKPDKSNRPQKRVYLCTGGFICIRKN